MVTTPVVPTPINIDRPLTIPGVMFAPEVQEIETKLPPEAKNALEAIGRRMESEIFSPIMNSGTREQLREEFTRVFSRFTNFYFSVSFLLGGETQDVASLASIWTLTAATLKAELEGRGDKTIGEKAVNDMLVGLASVSQVNRKLLKLAQIGCEIDNLKELQSWFLAYWLATSCVFYYHFDGVGSLQNARTLASWSRYYATGVYRSAKDLGLIKVPRKRGPIPKITEEDRIFSESGLDDLVAHLTAEGS